MNWFLSRAKKAENLPETALRVLILGSSNVGKTTLIDAITKQESPKPIYTPTYGCNLQIQQQIWLELMEVGGRTKHDKTIDVFTQRFDVLILVFDTTNIKTFKDLESLLIRANPDSTTPVIVIGTRTDLIQNGYFAVSFKDDPFYKFLLQKGYVVADMSLYAFDFTPLEHCFNDLCMAPRKSAHDILDLP